MLEDNFIEPVARLRAEKARRAQSERSELVSTFMAATAESYKRAQEKQRELEEVISRHGEWFNQHEDRLLALLPFVPPALAEYERKRDAYRGQIFQALRDRNQVTANHLWGNRRDGVRDPAALVNFINLVNNQLGQCAFAGALDRVHKQIEIHILAIEARGGGLQQPEPAPAAAPTTTTATSKKKLNK